MNQLALRGNSQLPPTAMVALYLKVRAPAPHAEFNQWAHITAGSQTEETGYSQTQDPGRSEPCSHLPTLPCGAHMI